KVLANGVADDAPVAKELCALAVLQATEFRAIGLPRALVPNYRSRDPGCIGLPIDLQFYQITWSKIHGQTESDFHTCLRVSQPDCWTLSSCDSPTDPDVFKGTRVRKLGWRDDGSHWLTQTRSTV